jgi:hypothetical protein
MVLTLMYYSKNSWFLAFFLSKTVKRKRGFRNKTFFPPSGDKRDTN